MGVVAALAAAVSWALASAMLASQVQRLDTLSASALRTIGASLFFVVAVFVLGADADIAHMAAGDILQLIGTGVILLVLGESLYTAAIASIGLTRTFATVIGLEYVVAFLLAALLIGEAVTWQEVLGALLVLVGVYFVSLYGRTRRTALVAEPAPGGGGAPAVPAGAPSRATKLGGTVLPIIGRVTPGFWAGLALAVAAGIAWGGNVVWLRSAAEGSDAAAAGAVRLVGAAPLLLLATVMQRDWSAQRGTVSRRTVSVLVLSGVLGYGVASLLFIVALGRIGTGPSVVLFSTSPIFGLAFGALFLRDPITIWMLIGTLLAVAGVALIA